ncbi:hypothetical protein [Microbacterium esteraromaticum]|uniref:hypothetical protein n=1 Tax=Microbacterium esteraromaticum TaxID=57043 RepID=UPI00195B444B|nr:hypothetical protein [Microbacterium esteraromaticum]MBM7466090.1 hypothetical protein [Microbacterium esteraromaticum]
MTDFQWWAEIWIPAGTGTATLVVSGIALWVSHRATRMAEKVEEQRQAAEVERTADELRRRLIEMAIGEARVLQRWVIEQTRPGLFWSQLNRNRNHPSQRSAVEQAKINARVALTQSLVPGADDLLRITTFDLENLHLYIAQQTKDSDETNAARANMLERRIERTTTRIRFWGLDPIQTAREVERDLRLIDGSPLEYLMFGDVRLAAMDESRI